MLIAGGKNERVKRECKQKLLGTRIVYGAISVSETGRTQ